MENIQYAAAGGSGTGRGHQIITNATSDSDYIARFFPLSVTTKLTFTITETHTGQSQEEESVLAPTAACYSKATRIIPSHIELVFDGHPFFPVSLPDDIEEDRDNDDLSTIKALPLNCLSTSR